MLSVSPSECETTVLQAHVLCDLPVVIIYFLYFGLVFIIVTYLILFILFHFFLFLLQQAV